MDLKNDHDPTSPGTDEPEGTIDSWTLDLDTLSKRTVREVLPHGTGDTEYLVEIDAYSSVNGYVLFLKGDTDISAINSGETYDTRNTIFAPDPHEHYDRSGSVSSTPHVRGITVANSTSNSVTFLVTFSEAVTGLDISDFVAYKDWISYGPVITSNTKTPNIPLHARYGIVEDTIVVDGYTDDDSTVVLLGVDINHTSQGDLRFYLTLPDGTKKTVYRNSGLNQTDDDLVHTFRVLNFGSKGMNGEWTLHVEDYVDSEPIQKLAFLNEWTLSLAYQAEPTYDELQGIASEIGDVAAFAPLHGASHVLRLYPDALSVKPIRSPGVLFDTYHDGIIEFVPRTNDNVLFTSNSYIRYPMTVEVYVANVRLSSQSDCSNALDLGRDGLYQPGEILMIPILPGTPILCMEIAGADVVIHLEDVLAQSHNIQHTGIAV